MILLRAMLLDDLAPASSNADSPLSAALLRWGSRGTLPRKGTPMLAAIFSAAPCCWMEDIHGCDQALVSINMPSVLRSIQ